MIQLVHRSYRKQLELEKQLAEVNERIARLTGRLELLATIAAHCRRLLAEKETLMKVMGANRFMAAPLRAAAANPGARMAGLQDAMREQYPGFCADAHMAFFKLSQEARQ